MVKGIMKFNKKLNQMSFEKAIAVRTLKNNGIKRFVMVERLTSIGTFLFLLVFLMMGCRVIPPIIEESNRMSVAQKKILNRDYDGARTTLSRIYETSNLKTEKGEALYWIAYTHIKESQYKEARNFLETADKLYRSGPLLGSISARIIACALLENDELRANKQYAWIQDKRVGEMAEINFIMGTHFRKTGDRNQARIYFQKCVASGDNFFSRKASSYVHDVSGGTFYLVVGRFSNQNNINKLMAKLKNEYSLKPYLKESKSSEVKLYTVCIGKFNSLEEAESERIKIKVKHPELELVVRP